MKPFLFLSLFALVCVGSSSCKRCQVCTKNSEPEVRVCEKDYSSNTEYGLVLDGMEVAGYSCKNSL